MVGLECEAGKTIAAVEFASFGTPTGYCGHFEVGTCNDPDTSTVVEGLCLNKQYVSACLCVWGGVCVCVCVRHNRHRVRCQVLQHPCIAVHIQRPVPRRDQATERASSMRVVKCLARGNVEHDGNARRSFTDCYCTHTAHTPTAHTPTQQHALLRRALLVVVAVTDTQLRHAGDAHS